MTTLVPPPLAGYNNNFRYRGMSFHIQTEDSGVGRPHITTHLFADGGRVIKTLRIDYSEHLDDPDRPALVQHLMREQHRAMAYDLRKGGIDAAIDELEAKPVRAIDSGPRPATASEETALPESRSPSRRATARGAARVRPDLRNYFSAMPPDSLDDLILRYIDQKPGPLGKHEI